MVLDVVVELGEGSNVALPPARGAVPALVEADDGEAGRVELAGDVFVPAAVFRDPMADHDDPARARRGPGPTELGHPIAGGGDLGVGGVLQPGCERVVRHRRALLSMQVVGGRRR